MQKQAARRKEIDMLNDPILQRVILFAIPLILTNMLQLVYNAADIIVVGQFDGLEAVAAVGATTSLYNLFSNLSISLSSGTSMCLSVQLGAKNHKEAFEYTHTSVVTALVIGVLMGVLGFFTAEPLLRLLKTDPIILERSTLYLKIIFLGFPATLLYNYTANIIRTIGNTKSPLIYLAISGVANVALNVVFVAGFHMGVAGVAIATLSSQVLSAILCVRYLHRLPMEHPCHLYFTRLRMYNNKFARILNAGIPIALNSMAFSVANVTIQSSVNTFGVAGVSGSSSAASIEGFTYVAMNSVVQASLIFIGQNRGAGKYDRIKRIIFNNVLLVSAVGIVMGGATFLLARPLLSLYLGQGEDLAVAFGVNRMMCVLLPYFICGIMDTLIYCSRGLGASFWPMVFSISAVFGIRVLWVFLVLPYLSTIFTDVFVQYRILFLSYPISWFLSCIPQSIYLACRYKKMKRERENLQAL
ncbi:MAG: MATE family efflux transporter [Clostridia bacterium]|nr:MATE family efflux transporter [Clostridia bacterium]